MELKNIPIIAIDNPTNTEIALKIIFSSRADNIPLSINSVKML